MRYFNIEGNIEIDDSKLTKEIRAKLEDNLIDTILEVIVKEFDASFGGGIKEVDLDGKDLTKKI